MTDPKLVESVLGEVWDLDGEAQSAHEFARVEVDGRLAGDFWQSDSSDVDAERARQAVLGHRALQLLVERHDEATRQTGECMHQPNCAATAIIKELRG